MASKTISKNELDAKAARCAKAIKDYRVVYKNLNASFKAVQKAETAFEKINPHQSPNHHDRVRFAKILEMLDIEMKVTQIRKNNICGELGKTVKALVKLESDLKL